MLIPVLTKLTHVLQMIFNNGYEDMFRTASHVTHRPQ